MSVQYANDSGTGFEADIHLLNGSGAPVSMDSVTLRYWFTIDEYDVSEYMLEGYYYSLEGSCSSVVGTVSTLANSVTGADAYVDITFQSGTLLAGSEMILSMQIRTVSWSVIDASNDYSYIDTTGAWDGLGVYVDDELVWGVPPT